MLFVVKHLLSLRIVRKGVKKITWICLAATSYSYSAVLRNKAAGIEKAGLQSQQCLRAVKQGLQTVISLSSLR